MYGVWVGFSQNCIFTQNLFDGNINGIFFSATTFDNVLFSNSFVHSTYRNAWDNGVRNTFDDGVGTGNTWGDYLGFGVYIIPGSSGSIDRYPSPGIAGILVRSSVILLLAVILIVIIRRISSRRSN